MRLFFKPETNQWQIQSPAVMQGGLTEAGSGVLQCLQRQSEGKVSQFELGRDHLLEVSSTLSGLET